MMMRCLEMCALFFLWLSFVILKKLPFIFADIPASFQIRIPFFLPGARLLSRFFGLMQILMLLSTIALAASWMGLDEGAVDRFREHAAQKLWQYKFGAWILRYRSYLFGVWALFLIVLVVFLSRLPIFKFTVIGK